MIDEQKARAMFCLAGIEVLKMKPLPDGYWYKPSDPRYFEAPPRCVWWFVKTPHGWVEIGNRKRVIAIDWSDTDIRKIVTKDDHSVHAWTEEKAIEYLKGLFSEDTQ